LIAGSRRRNRKSAWDATVAFCRFPNLFAADLAFVTERWLHANPVQLHGLYNNMPWQSIAVVVQMTVRFGANDSVLHESHGVVTEPG